QIKKLAKEKLKFTPLTETEIELYQGVVNYKNISGLGGFTQAAIKEAEERLPTGGTYSVNNPEYLTGANISVCFTRELMDAIENDGMYQLRFHDVENDTDEEINAYKDNKQDI